MIKKVRKLLGWSQTDMAVYLKISRSVMSMVEIGQRDLPFNSQLIFSRLEKIIAAARSSNEKITESQNTKKNKALKKLIAESENSIKDRINSADYKLQKMKEENVRAAILLKTVELMRADEQPREKTFIDITEMNAVNLEKKSGRAAQLKLKLKKEGMKAGLTYLRNIESSNI